MSKRYSSDQPAYERVNGHLWIYIFGEKGSADVGLKIGKTDQTLEERRRQLERGSYRSTPPLVLLAAMRSEPNREGQIQRYFADECIEREYFAPSERLLEYVNWLRTRWWVTVDETDPVHEVVEYDHWAPDASRQLARPDYDPNRLFNVERAWQGPLAGTRWDWLALPDRIVNDYYTPLEHVDAARAAMGGIDLDPASHYVANRKLRIPEFYDVHRDGLKQPWFGRLWMNPPYGQNQRWFERLVDSFDAGEVAQACMLAPVWAFTTQQARPVMERVTAQVLLSPTPRFWGNPQGAAGSNHPHMVIYLGSRGEAFRLAYRSLGYPFKFETFQRELEVAA